MHNVVDIKFDQSNKNFAVVFKTYDSTDEVYKNVVTFHTWTSGGKTAALNSIAYTINEAFDEEVYDSFGNLSLY